MPSWHETVRRTVSHSFSVSGSFSVQLLFHSGFQWVYPLTIGGLSMTRPHLVQTLSPGAPSGVVVSLLQAGQFNCVSFLPRFWLAFPMFRFSAVSGLVGI